MHGLVVEVSIDSTRGDEALKLLNEVVVPAVRSAPGLVAAYWLGGPDAGRGTSGVALRRTSTATIALGNVARANHGHELAV